MIRNLEISNPEKQLVARAQNFSGHFSYPVDSNASEQSSLIWKQIISSAVLEKGEIHLEERWSVTDLQGSLALSPHQDPELKLKGNMQTPTKPLKFQLEGKGALHEDDSFWLELAMRLSENREKECAIHFSLLQP